MIQASNVVWAALRLALKLASKVLESAYTWPWYVKYFAAAAHLFNELIGCDAFFEGKYEIVPPEWLPDKSKTFKELRRFIRREPQLAFSKEGRHVTQEASSWYVKKSNFIWLAER